MSAKFLKNKAANSPKISDSNKYSTDPHRIAVKENQRVPKNKKRKADSLQVFFLIEKKPDRVELIGKSFPKPMPQKMNKFQQEIRGNIVFLISIPVWKKYKEEVLITIKKHVMQRMERMAGITNVD